MSQLCVRRDRTNSPFAAGIGQPWIGFCLACRRGATFSAWDYAIDWVVGHCADTAHTPLDKHGLDYSRPVDNTDPAATVPNGVELIPVTGRHSHRLTTVERPLGGA